MFCLQVDGPITEPTYKWREQFTLFASLQVTGQRLEFQSVHCVQ